MWQSCSPRVFQAKHVAHSQQAMTAEGHKHIKQNKKQRKCQALFTVAAESFLFLFGVRSSVQTKTFLDFQVFRLHLQQL